MGSWAEATVASAKAETATLMKRIFENLVYVEDE